MLEDASIKLSSVAASLTSVSARAMLAAMIDGETRPAGAGRAGRGPMRRKIPDLAAGADRALRRRTTPSWRERCCSGCGWSRQAQAELDAVIADACQPWRTRSSCCRPSPGSGRRSPR